MANYPAAVAGQVLEKKKTMGLTDDSDEKPPYPAEPPYFPG
jgi:hypothetical protein